MYSASPEQEINVINNRFAQETYTPGNGTFIAIEATKKSFSKAQQFIAGLTQPSDVAYFSSRPARVTYSDITVAQDSVAKRAFKAARRAMSNPNRVTFFDAGRRHSHIIFFDSSSRF